LEGTAVSEHRPVLARRQLLKLFGALGAAGAAGSVLAACDASGTAGSDTTPVRIGLIVPQSSPNKPIGDDLIAGFQLYLNLHGTRLGGHPVQLITAEEGDSADSGRAAVDKLIKEHAVAAMSGVASSTVMTAIRDQVENAQVPLLGSNASPSNLGSVKYIWRTSYVNDEAGRALGGYLALKRNQSVYVIGDDSDTSREQVAGFLRTFRGIPDHPSLAGDAAQVPASNISSASLAGYLTAIRTSGAKVVFAAFNGDAATTFVKAYRAAAIGAQLYAPGFITEGTRALQSLGDGANGIYTAMNYAPDLDNGANRTFASSYQQVYNQLPSTYAMASYDAAAVLDKAIGITGSDLAPQSINTALSEIGQVDSPRGSWQFNQTRTPLQRWYLRQVRREGQVLTNAMLGDLAMLG
jgi:branched-chain amino acid transport system substrate-binding protein